MFMPDRLKLDSKEMEKSKVSPYVIMDARSIMSCENISIKHTCYVPC